MHKTVIITTAVTALLSALGCMSFTFGGRTEVVSPPPVPGPVAGTAEWQQMGNVRVPVGEEMTVYYPIPYASPPNLVITGRGGACRVIEQKADCFCIKNNSDLPFELGWTARGVKAPPPVPVVDTPATAPALANPVTH